MSHTQRLESNQSVGNIDTGICMEYSPFLFAGNKCVFPNLEIFFTISRKKLA